MISDNREHFQSIIDEVARRPWGPDGCFNFGSAVNMRMQALLDELCDTTPEYFDDLCEQLGQDDDLSGLHRDDILDDYWMTSHFYPLWALYGDCLLYTSPSPRD